MNSFLERANITPSPLTAAPTARSPYEEQLRYTKAAYEKFLKEMLRKTSLKVVSYTDGLYGKVEVIVNPKDWSDPKSVWAGAVWVKFTSPVEAVKLAEEYRNPWPSMKGFKVRTPARSTSLYVSPEYSSPNPRSIAELKRLVAHIPTFLDTLAESSYRHSGD
jgi:hypothetical protein